MISNAKSQRTRQSKGIQIEMLTPDTAPLIPICLLTLLGSVAGVEGGILRQFLWETQSNSYGRLNRIQERVTTERDP